MKFFFTLTIDAYLPLLSYITSTNLHMKLSKVSRGKKENGDVEGGKKRKEIRKARKRDERQIL